MERKSIDKSAKEKLILEISKTNKPLKTDQENKR